MSEYFFGREEQLALLRKNFFVRTPGSGFCGSLKGPNDIGKTMLIRQAAREFEQEPHPNVYYFPVGIIATGSYWQFWVDLIRRFAVRIPERKLQAAPNPDPEFIELILETYAFFKDPANLDRIGTQSFHSEAVDHLNFLFEYYTELGIHILISIDEFDNAREAFPVDGKDGSFFQRLYMMSPKSSNEYSLSILLISRRRIGTIAHHMADGSDIESAFPPFIVLRGFTNRELDAYFDSYADIPGVSLTEEQKQQIIYFCGRHPGQLMKMRTLYERHFDPAAPASPAALYREYGEEMQTLYERMNRLLRTEFVDAEKKCSCVGTFSQAFIGPTYDPNIKSRLEQLHKYGLLSKWDKSGGNIFQLAGLPYDDAAERRFDYEPMSAYYVEFFKARVLPEELDLLDRLVTIAELDVRAGILKVLKAVCPDTWENVLNSYISSGKQSYITKLENVAQRNDALVRNITYTNLDVMAFNDYSKIITAYWENMYPFFRSFRTEAELKDAFAFLNDCRNCFAHNNERILDEQSCSRLKDLCSRLIEDYKKGEAGVPAQKPAAEATAPAAPAAPAAAEPGVVLPTAQQVENVLNRMSVVTFCYQKKKPNGNLRGVIKGLGYPAGISKANQAAFGADFAPETGAEIKAKILRWDANAEMFNLVAP